MAKEVLKNAGIYLAGYELSGYANAAGLEGDTEVFDVTTFSSAGFEEYITGAKRARFSAAGIWSPEEVDAVLEAKLGTIDQVMTFAAQNVAGGTAFFWKGVAGQYRFAAAVRRPGEWSASGSLTAAPLVRGNILHRVAAATSSSASTGQQLGAVASTKKIHAALHVFDVDGTSPTLDVIVQSDNASNFPSPTTRLTFAQKTAIGAEMIEAGPAAITDDWWRISFTIGGTTPSFGFLCSFGIR